jgi:YggT family protein
MQAIYFIFNTLLSLLVVAFLLRAVMPLVRADFRNPFGEAVLKLTNPLVLPLRRIFPPKRRFDLASFIALLLVQLIKTTVLGLVLGWPLRVDTILLGGLYDLLITVIQFYVFAVVIYALLSWFSGASYNPIAKILARVCEPLLSPVRRVIPPLGGLDLSALFVIIALQALLILLRTHGP